MKTISSGPFENVRAGGVSNSSLRRVLLVCGILSALLHFAMNALVPLLYPGYSYASHTVSELSAIDAPTRTIWLLLAGVYTVLFAGFAWGVWLSAGRNRPLRFVGDLLVVCGVLGFFWPPMHQREVLAAGGATMTDTLHIAWTMIWGLLTLLAMGFAAAAFGKLFRIYSIASIVALLAFGTLTSIDAPNMQANLPTPWMGAWERLNIATFLIWLIVLSTTLLRTTNNMERSK
jgi:hypothetical protein